MNPDGRAAEREIERVARESYGRLLAYLCRRTRDLAAAEDALGEALVAALRNWPRQGVPEVPEAWLLITARHVLTDAARHARVVAASAPALRLLRPPARAAEAAPLFPDERLKLFFVCAHPEIEASVHAPLMLQVVLGLNAAHIAEAFQVSAAAMSQRLVRAKRAIARAGLIFADPPARELPRRKAAVLDAIYAAFGLGWEINPSREQAARDLSEEAIWLGRGMVEVMPTDGEARGLLALMLHCHARREARRSLEGTYVPLERQNAARWSRPLMAEAERHLTEAAKGSAMGRYQLEAAIQSVHAARAFGGETDWGVLARLHQELLAVAPTLGAEVALAAALAEAEDPLAGLAVLDRMPGRATADYQPYWAVRAQLLQLLGRGREAAGAFGRAAALAPSAAVREFLLSKSAGATRQGNRKAGEQV